MNRLQPFLFPKKIAVIGASRKEGSLGKMFLDAIIGMDYRGAIYPVNPKAETISGLKAYPSVDALPDKPDLTVILLPQKFVLDTVENLGEMGMTNIVIISAGFKEIGGEGIKREEKLLELKDKYDLNLLGPNCMGIFNTHPTVSFNGTFSPTLPRPGHVAYVSQSGALGVAIMELAAHTDLGFSVFVSTGNKADINDNDVVDILRHDTNTHVITLYLESIDDPQRLQKVCARTVAVKPVLAVKAGRTESGHRAASSHTGALANPEYVMDGFLKQCGVIRMESLQELFEAARAFAVQPLPKGSRTAIITNAGGPGILASDAVESTGLRLASFKEETMANLHAILPEEAATTNPVDMIASADHETYARVAETVLEDDGVDSVVVIIVKPPIDTTPARIIEHLQPVVQGCSKTVLAVVMAQKDESAGMKRFMEAGIPVYDYPESAVKALATQWRYQQIQQRFRKSEAVVISPETTRATPLSSHSGTKQAAPEALLEIINEYGIELPDFKISSALQELLTFYKQLKSNVALKIANERIIHKSDLGLVKLNLNSEEAIRAAFEFMSAKAREILEEKEEPRFLIQKQLPESVEMALGGKRDEQFGAVVMGGLGGVFVEVLKDVSFRVAPVNAYEAKEMIQEWRAQPLLNGARGLPVVNRDALAFTIKQFSLLMAEHPEILEMDLNPLIWDAKRQKPVAVDVRATLQ